MTGRERVLAAARDGGWDVRDLDWGMTMILTKDDDYIQVHTKRNGAVFFAVTPNGLIAGKDKAQQIIDYIEEYESRAAFELGLSFPSSGGSYALGKEYTEAIVDQLNARLAEIKPPDRRSKESDDDYASRCFRWWAWRNQEPLVDLTNVSDTEVAEYRQWAGTKKHHDDLVKELTDHFSGRKP
jgi:hypothetical protein